MDYDIEDTPKFWAIQELEKQFYYEELERKLKNESR